MGTTAENSVVDQNLKLHTEENIYVIDASVMPTSASTHTMLPVMAMADLAVHKMLAADQA
jgi:choline dehydrogenase-like flavoprotein